MERFNIYKTTTYCDGLYNIDIVETPSSYEAWLWRSDMGIKVMMFGVPDQQQTKKEFLEIVERNLPEYEDDYEEEYCR